MNKIIVSKEKVDANDAFVLTTEDLESIKIQLYINSQVWDEADIDFYNNLVADQFGWVSTTTKVNINFKEEPSKQGIPVLCKIFPQQAPYIRRMAASGDIAKIGGYLHEVLH